MPPRSRPESTARTPTPPRAASVDDIRAVTARAAAMTGAYELDLAAYHFLADSAPDLDYIGHWVSHALGQLLDEMRRWPDDGPAAAAAADPPPRAEQRALTGSVLALEALCDADTADPAVAFARLEPCRRRVARRAAQLAMAADGHPAREAWDALMDALDAARAEA